MPFTGSSALIYRTTLFGPTGPTGPSGITGATGITGPLISGSRGPSGSGIIEFTSTTAKVLTTLISGTGSVSINIQGRTAAYLDEYAVIKGATTNGFSVILFRDSNSRDLNTQELPIGRTLELKGLTFKSSTGSITSATTSSTYISVVGKTYQFFPVGDTGNIAYVYDTNKAKGVPNSYWDAGISMLDIPLASERLAVSGNKNFQTSAFTQNIRGFSGSTGHMLPTLVFNPAIAFDPNPSRYQASFDVHGGLTLFQSFNVGTTGAVSLNTSFLPNTYILGVSFTPQIITDDTLGSCCLCELNAGITAGIHCLDYVNKQYCLDMGGSFNTTACADRVVNGDCFAEGACCVNGKCVNTSEELCVRYNGFFHPNQICNATEGGGDLYFTCNTFCPTTETRGKCCVHGKCFNLSESECNAIANSVFLSGTCSGDCDVDCKSTAFGGCCVDGSVLSQLKLPEECSQLGGIFLGPSVTSGRCCGRDGTINYFNDSTSCRVTSNIPCLPLGTRIGGGYLVGIIGEPSPCTSFLSPLVAEGQVLGCRYYPRGFVSGENSLTWKYKNCFGDSGITFGTTDLPASTVNIKYFNRTHPEKLTIDNKNNICLFKGGSPYVMQTYEGVVRQTTTAQQVTQWADDVMFNAPPSYGALSYSLGDLSKVLLFEGLGLPNSDIYRSLATQFYASSGIPVLWALIVAPDDIEVESSNLLKWGMSEGRVRNSGTDKFNLEPISTCAVDGLLSTRIHDESSKENTYFWYRTQTEASRKKSYDRFCFYTNSSVNVSNWNSNVSETDIENNSILFKLKYADMWDSNNSTDSCTKQISISNQTGINGYHDWYIPSIIELNYIYGNIDLLNSSLLINGDSPIDDTMSYWSSTSLCTLHTWNNANHTDSSFYGIFETPDGNYNTKFRFTRSDFDLGEDELYALSMNVCAGETMLTQRFSDGFVSSISRDSKVAALRPVRRIPIVTIPCNSTYSIQSAFSSYDVESCPSCPDGCS